MGLLSDAACRAGKPGQELHDGGNLVLRIGARSKTWAMVWQADGKTRKASLGSYPAMGLSGARQAVQEAMVRVRRGLSPTLVPEASSPLVPAVGITVKSVLDTYMARHIIPTAKDPDQVQWVVDRLLADLHTRDASKLTRRELVTFLDDLSDQRGSPSAYRAGSVLRAAFRFCLRRGDIETDPTHMLPLPSSGQVRERQLSMDEVRLIFKAKTPTWARFARVLLLSGLRLREASDAPWSEFSDDLWEIPAARMKAGLPHVVPLHDRLREELGTSNGSWVFKSPRRFDQPIKGFTRGLELLQRDSGTSDWNWHDTRRTVATNLQRLGAPDGVVESVLAHTPPKLRRTYNKHSFVEERRMWLDRWAKEIQA